MGLREKKVGVGINNEKLAKYNKRLNITRGLRTSMRFSLWLEDNDQLQQLVKSLEAQHPEIIKLFAWESDHEIHLHDIEIRKDARNQGIGSIVMREIKKFAVSVGKPLTLTPEFQRGKKATLNRFYRRHGMVRNIGRKKDYTLRPGMLWRPEWEIKHENSWLAESQSSIAYHQTDESGVKGIVQSGKFNTGQGHYGNAVYLTLSPPKNYQDLGGYVVSANVNLEGFDLDADPSDYIQNNSVPGFAFDNYDTSSKWLVVYDTSRLQPYQFTKDMRQWYPASAEGLMQSGLQSTERTPEQERLWQGSRYISPKTRNFHADANERIEKRRTEKKEREWAQHLQYQQHLRQRT